MATVLKVLSFSFHSNIHFISETKLRVFRLVTEKETSDCMKMHRLELAGNEQKRNGILEESTHPDDFCVRSGRSLQQEEAAHQQRRLHLYS